MHPISTWLISFSSFIHSASSECNQAPCSHVPCNHALSNSTCVLPCCFFAPEREVLDSCVRVMEGAAGAPSATAGVRELLAPVVALYAARCVEEDLGWFLSQEIIPARVSTARFSQVC